MRSQELFLNFLTQRGFLTAKRRELVSNTVEKQPGSNLVEILVHGGFVNSEDLARYEAEFFNLRACKLDKKIDDSILAVLPFTLARDSGAICFFVEDRNLKIAVVYPEAENMVNLRFWARENNFHVEYYICSLTDYEKQLNFYLNKSEMQEKKMPLAKSEESFAPSNLDNMPLDKVLAIILREALEHEVQEILLSQEDKRILVRFRIQNVLKNVINLPENVYGSLVNYLKGLAHLPLSIKNNFVEGQIEIRVKEAERKYNLKVLNSVGGEVISIKPIEIARRHLDFEQLGFNQHLQKAINEGLTNKQGKIVVFGLGGSGKTTILNSLVQKLSDDGHHVISLGPSVERPLPNVTRIQIKPELGLSYQNVLPEIHRWQPDYLAIDEVNNSQIAEHALRSALAGTPVLSTAEGVDIVQGLKNLLDLDLELYHLSSLLNLVIAQKLVRRVCSHCAESVILPADKMRKILNVLASVPPEYWPRGLNFNSAAFYVPEASGCSWCDYTGYAGQLALQEGLLFDAKIKRELAQIRKKVEINQLIERHLLINLLQDGLMKSLRGLTTVDEVFSNCEEYNII